MVKILVHVTVGPDDPTKAALAFLMARAVIEEGNQLVLFVAGDGVHLLTRTSASSIEGLGTGNARTIPANIAVDGLDIVQERGTPDFRLTP